jgi:hypothetical protein
MEVIKGKCVLLICPCDESKIIRETERKKSENGDTKTKNFQTQKDQKTKNRTKNLE